MTSTAGKDTFSTIAQIISIVFHPLFIPVYGMMIIFSAPTLFGYLPFEVKKLLMLIIIVNNVLLPFALLPLFRYRNIISSWFLEERKERIIPLLITTILYAATVYITLRFPIPAFLKTFIMAAFIISLTVTMINFWWKISIHAVGAGALTALVLVLSLRMYAQLIWYLVPVIVIAGLILSSRLKLNHHNPPQVWFGYLTGSFVLILFLWFF